MSRQWLHLIGTLMLPAAALPCTKGHWPGHSKGGATVNATVGERLADMGRGAVYHDNRVRVERV